MAILQSARVTNIHAHDVVQADWRLLDRVPASVLAQRMCDGTQAKLPGAPPPLEVPPFMYGAPMNHSGVKMIFSSAWPEARVQIIVGSLQ